jgi:hypothetical protein
MPSVLERLSEALNECRNLRLAQEKETEERRRDHDVLIKQGERVRTLFERVEVLERAERDRADEQKAELKNEIKDDKTDHKGEIKEKRTNWSLLWITLGGAGLSAVGTVVLMKLLNVH